MRHLLAAAIVTGLGAAAGAKASEMAPVPKRSTDLPRPRDGDVAIRQELEAARRAGTLAAYDLFLERHRQHPLAGVARRERVALAARREK
jgi:hypothetical protein